MTDDTLITVPLEPTNEMLAAGAKVWGRTKMGMTEYRMAMAIYKAMIEAYIHEEDQ